MVMRLRTWWHNLPLRAKGVVVIGIPVVPLLVTAALFVANERAHARAEEAVESTWGARVELTRAYSAIREAESAVRGYALTGHSEWIEAYHARESELPHMLRFLDSVVVDPKMRLQLGELRELTERRLLRLADTAANAGPGKPVPIAQLERGEAVSKELSAVVQQMFTRQDALLAERRARAAVLARRTTTGVLVGTAAGVVGGLLAALLFTTGIVRRLEVATQNAALLGDGKPLKPMMPTHDEIGVLTRGMETAAALLAARDEELRGRVEEVSVVNHELEAFTYSVSHDLRAPLRHVAGFATMLQKSAGSALTDAQRRYITTIVEAAGRMGRLIDDLLAFSRTGRAEMRQKVLDLGTVVRDAQQELTAEMNGRDVRWTVHPLPVVRGDAAMIRVAFDNLLSNAVKYTRPRAEARIEIGAADRRDETVIYVRDNGVGFDMQYVDKLFGVFERLHDSDEFEGTGIGLATVRRIIARHGGRVWAEGRPDEGATFYVAFPTGAPTG
jgi:signal transduction histidine kinase